MPSTPHPNLNRMAQPKYHHVAKQILEILPQLGMKSAYAVAEKFEGNQERAIAWALEHAEEAGKLNPSAEYSSAAAPASGASNTTAGADAELQKALQLSLQTATGANGAVAGFSEEDINMQKAIEASKNTTPVIDLTGDGASGFAGEDANLQAAMLASIQGTDASTMGMVSNDPVARQRDPKLPVGLKNVGNTCYLNSLLQTYFMMPQLRKRVLSLDLKSPSPKPSNDPNPASPPGKDDTTPFMKELQRMYSYLIASQEKFFDPSKLFKSLVDEQGNPVRIGSQEDVGEFNDLFLWRVGKGLATPSDSAPAEAQQQTPDFATAMFDSEATEILVAKDESGEMKEVEKPVSMGRHLILPVGKGIRDIHQAMDHFMCDSMDGYRFESGYQAPEAFKYKWFKRLPTIVMFQQNRVHYDAGVPKKVNDTLKFDEVVYMDRYMHENKSVTMSRRETVNAWRKELEQLEAQHARLVDFNSSGMHVDKLLDHVTAYLQEREKRSGLDIQEIDQIQQTVGYLQLCSNQEQVQKKELETKIEALQNKIDGEYDDMKKIPYRLFAVWVHAGGAGSGHYWAHIRDTQNGGRWIKFNDVHCSNVSQEDVFKDALGGPGITSAYFLIYMSEDEYQKNLFPGAVDGSAEAVPQVAPLAMIPDAWRKEIEEANTKLLKEVEDATKNSTDKKMERFMTSLTSKLRSAQEISNTYTLASDMRVRNFPAFLMSGGLVQEAISFLIKEHWVVEFSRGVEKDMESSAFQLACAKLAPIGGEEVMRTAVDSAFNRDREDQLKRLHQEFRAVFHIFSMGLTAMNEQKFHDAVRYLAVAHRRNQALIEEQKCFDAARRRDIEPALQLALLSAYDEVMNKPSKYAKTLWKDVVDVVRWAYHGEHPFMVAFREKYFNSILGEEDSSRSAEDANALEVIKEIGERLVAEDAIAFPITSFSDPKPYDEPEQWETLVSRTKSALVTFKKEDLYHAELQMMLFSNENTPIFPEDSPPSTKLNIPGLELLTTSGTAQASTTKDESSHSLVNTNLNNYDLPSNWKPQSPDPMDVD
eukprot:TRINITY_DN5797_c0_g1_i1.p1 TRINITY_DN5797_c0_g1~~TRINITY_DN5797_c0_g1_i1.p1  ORF type:complete len:1044 (-),score=252.43 TRINITY_DN5797_c0_g1_i1:14-3145(-)